MTLLSLLLITKILVTFVLVAAPFLFFPKAKLEKIIYVTTPSILFFRLYGIAILALLVGYAFGVPIAENGNFPTGVVSMGLVSNFGAAILLFRFGRGSTNTVMAAFFSLIAICLFVSLLFPEFSVKKVW